MEGKREEVGGIELKKGEKKKMKNSQSNISLYKYLSFKEV